MTLEAKIKMVDALVREDPNSTIADYLALLADVESIEKGEVGQEPPLSVTDWVMKLAATKTVPQMKKETNFSYSTIYRALDKLGIDPKDLTTAARQRKRQEAHENAMKLIIRCQLPQSNSKYGIAS